MAYVGEEMHPKSVGLAMGLYISGSSLGGMGGRLLTGVLVDFVSWRAALATLGCLCLVAGVIFWRSLPRRRGFGRSRCTPATWSPGLSSCSATRACPGCSRKASC